MPTDVLLDTDIGSDIDDALCLAYLLAQPPCTLFGITTATGEARIGIGGRNRGVSWLLGGAARFSDA